MTDMEHSRRRAFSSFIDAQMTPAARYGIVILAALLCIQGLRIMSERTSRLQDVARNLASEIELMSDPELAPTWEARAAKAEEAAKAWSELAWSATAPGIAAAELEASLRARFEANGFQKLQIEVNPELIDKGQLKFIRFSITGQIPKSRAHALLAELAASKPTLQIVSLQFSKQGADDFSARIDGLAPYAEK